jgi:hypothetical protein
MAEVKNAFIKSKMNKDLDSRLLPSGEYRDGQNIQVSKSEGEDVGALENALGNTLAVDFNQLAVSFLNDPAITSLDLKSIGMYTDTATSNIFVFLTDYNDEEYASNGVITYSPSANNFIYAYNSTTKQNPTLLAYGSFLNFSQSSPIYGINLLESLLFWTDNRNQPRKINWNEADGVYYNTEDKMSVAKYNPYQPIDMYYSDGSKHYTSMQDVVSPTLPNGTTANPFLNAPQGNPILNQNFEPASWPGDPDYLEEKFVRFSYRFKFNDGEYSIMAPFTQPAFIPKQDGYFLTTGAAGTTTDEDDAFRSSIVSFMQNKVNNIALYIPLPFAANSLYVNLDVVEIDILYKESDALSVKVLESINRNVFSINSDDSVNTSSVYTYQYQSRKPYRTLPESEIIRVFDRVPVKALGQEVISNRIVYSNFQDKHTPPASLNYNVAANQKYNFTNNTNNTLKYTSDVEYPMHTLKQNRNYQVGFVLSDRYGRQSTVVLSPVGNKKNEVFVEGGITYSGSTFYNPYKSDPGASNNIDSWPGDSLKIIIDGRIPASIEGFGYPGLYNGDATSSDYNPLGWYSYKVVVKQTEQDYYNVYLPGILNDYPDYTSNQRSDMPDPQNSIAHITLISDNVNKVPRDLTEVGPEQIQYRSEVKLFGRVTPNFNLNVKPDFNKPYYPGENTMTVVAISEQDNMFADAAAARTAPYSTVYQTDSNPYIARISQNTVGSNPIGSSQINNLTGVYDIILGVFETAPVESLIDIFYETSTSGLISEYNDASDAIDASSYVDFAWEQNESSVSGDKVSGASGFYPARPGLIPDPIIDSDLVLSSVSVNGSTEINGIPWKDNWNLIARQGGGVGSPRLWDLFCANTLYHRLNDADNWITFNISVTDNSAGGSTNVILPIVQKLINVKPSFTSEPSISFSGDRDLNASIYTATAINGLAVDADNVALPNITGANAFDNLSYEIVSQTPDLGLGLNITLEPQVSLGKAELFQRNGDASGLFVVVLKVTDSGQDSSLKTINVVFGEEQINSSFGNAKKQPFSEGLESSGLFWANDYSDVVGDMPADVNFTARAVYVDPNDPDKDLTFGNTPINVNGRRQEVVQTGDSIGDPGGYVDSSENGYTWRNTNRVPKSYQTSIPNSGNDLQSGTAYIKLDFSFKTWGTPNASYWPNSNNTYGAIWPCYMQFRAAGTSNWITAIDVEGSPITFGRTQQNVQLTGGDYNPNFKLGVITDNTESIGRPSTNNKPNPDAVQTTTVFPQQNEQATSSTASFVFVFGKDQSYNNTANDRFGDYRLLIRYPQDILTSNDSDIRAIPGPANVGQWIYPNNVFTFRGSSEVDKNVKVNISFGDFYYNNVSSGAASYPYSVANSGYASSDIASQVTPTTAVFAKEWSYKYVTQFYTNPDLTGKWTPSQAAGDWHSFSGRATSSAGVGAENSSNVENNQTVSASNLQNNNSLNERRWMAQFDASGKKLIRTAVPSTGLKAL